MQSYFLRCKHCSRKFNQAEAYQHQISEGYVGFDVDAREASV